MTETVKHEDRDVNVPAAATVRRRVVRRNRPEPARDEVAFRLLCHPSITRPGAVAFGNRPDIPPKPRLEVYPHVDLEHKMQADEAVLNSYGWVIASPGSSGSRLIESQVARSARPPHSWRKEMKLVWFAVVILAILSPAKAQIGLPPVFATSASTRD